jgi:hypothetical protein
MKPPVSTMTLIRPFIAQSRHWRRFLELALSAKRTVGIRLLDIARGGKKKAHRNAPSSKTLKSFNFAISLLLQN